MRTFLEISRNVRRISRAPRPASAVAAVDQRWSRDHRSLTTCVASVADVFGAKTTSWFNYQLIWMWRVNGAHNTATSATSSRHGEPACISIANGFWRTRRRRDGIVPRLGSSALASLFFPGEFLFFNLEFEWFPENKYSRTPSICLWGGERKIKLYTKGLLVLFKIFWRWSLRIPFCILV